MAFFLRYLFLVVMLAAHMVVDCAEVTAEKQEGPIVYEKMVGEKLVDISQVNPSIILDIRYATPNNFTGKKVYTQSKCYVRKSVALKLHAIQKELETLGLGLKIWDGYRPYAVQQIFWDLVPDPRYVGDPKKGSKHNRGSAVGITLVDKKGNELEMPSKFDDFSEKAHRNYAAMTPEAAKNCKLLELAMMKYGFSFFHEEWWHYDDENWKSFPLLNVSFEQLE